MMVSLVPQIGQAGLEDREVILREMQFFGDVPGERRMLTERKVVEEVWRKAESRCAILMVFVHIETVQAIEISKAVAASREFMFPRLIGGGL